MSKLKPLHTFYIILITQVFSLIGSRMSGLAIGIWVYKETNDASPLALTAFFSTLPYVLISNFAGVLADRWDRRYVIMLSDVGQGLATCFLMLVFLTDSFMLWHLYLVAFIQSLFSAFQGPAFMASITTLVPDQHRDRANAIQTLTGPASGVIAPIITGFAFALVGVTGVLAIDMITFFIATGVLLSIRIPAPPKTTDSNAKESSIWRDTIFGWKYLWGKRTLMYLILHATLLNFLLNGVFILQTPYIIARTNQEALLGTLLGIMNLGAILGGVVMSIWGGTRPRTNTIFPGLVMMGIFVMLYGLQLPIILMGVVIFFVMFPNPMVNAAFMSLLQSKVAPDVQGRVFAAVGQIAMLATPLAYLIVGPLVDNVFEASINSTHWHLIAPLVGDSKGAGMGLLFIVGGFLVTATSLLLYMFPSIRHVEANLPDSQLDESPSPEATTSASAAIDNMALSA